MALKYVVGIRTNQILSMVDEAEVNGACYLQLYSGAPPANPATAPSGTLLCEMLLPSPFMNAAAGVGTKNGVWSGAAIAAGNVGYFRIMNNTKATCHIQGTVSASGGGGDLIIDNVAVVVGTPVSATSITITAGNA